MGVGLTRPKAPVAGIDVAGVVEATGANVRGLANGDQVLGFCRGAFAEYACAAADLVVPKLAGLTFEQAADPSGDPKCPGWVLGPGDDGLAAGLQPGSGADGSADDLDVFAWGPFWPWVMSNSTFCTNADAWGHSSASGLCTQPARSVPIVPHSSSRAGPAAASTRSACPLAKTSSKAAVNLVYRHTGPG
jgi:hypothetical protein